MEFTYLAFLAYLTYLKGGRGGAIVGGYTTYPTKLEFLFSAVAYTSHDIEPKELCKVFCKALQPLRLKKNQP